MQIGVPKEIKDHEYRVSLTPDSVRSLVSAGHSVLVETAAGGGIGLTDRDYVAAGAAIAASPADVFAHAQMVVKVKEPQQQECELMRPGQTLFTYLHLAAEPRLTRQLLAQGIRAIAYETVTGPNRTLPLLQPMSEVAGRLSVQAGAHCLEKPQRGNGSLLGGVSGVAPAKVMIVGGGTVGVNAADIALGMGAEVFIFDRSQRRLGELKARYADRVQCIFSTAEALEKHALESDLVIGAVLLPGATAPKLLKADVVAKMKDGAVIVDVAIDQGGCFETSRPTTHQAPTYVVEEVVHYCVTNMPAIVPKTSTFALNNATLPYVAALAGQGIAQALAADAHLRQGLNVDNGRICHPAVMESYQKAGIR